MKIVICDLLGLSYDGSTLQKRGLGGSESAVILIAKELSKIGFDVTVINSCIDGKEASPGIYDNVRYIDHSQIDQYTDAPDIFISSRSVNPFLPSNQYNQISQKAKKKILWLHDTFIEGDQIMEDLVLAKKIDHVFTLSDWHTSYILTCAHGKKRNHEVLKKAIFQTRNGAVCHIPEVNLSHKDPNHFIYNASATKGMVPLVQDIWPRIKEKIPQAKLTIVGGYYRFRNGAAPDAQENTVSQLASRQDLKDMGITFTGVISQQEIAKLLANANMMLYPGAFPETFGISTLESLLYKTPVVTTRFGALEETAVEQACYLIDYAIEPNSLFPHIDKKQQIESFLETFFRAYNTPYLHQQKQNYCDVVKDIAGWDTVALQWKQFLYSVTDEFLPVDEYRKVTQINEKVSRVFGRTSIMPAPKRYSSFGKEKRILIISPFWNAEDYIEKNIRSVASQDYDNYLHVLIDDASTDNSNQVAKETIDSLDTDKIILKNRQENQGCIFNQFSAIHEHTREDDIIVFLDGDDWLINNNTIFHFYNDLYNRGYEFTYGSMWSVVDNIPLIAQEYPNEVKKAGTYRDCLFNWKIPYTHLRTVLSKHFLNLDHKPFLVRNGEWMKSGADNPLFYELIEKVDPDKIFCNREIVCNYNDVNPLNDYKIRGDEQNRNANKSYRKEIDAVREDVVNGKKFTHWNNDVSWNIIEKDWVDHHQSMIERIASNVNDVVIQAGGNQGLYPALLSDYFSQVYTFEPDSKNYEMLFKNCNNLDNVIHKNAALGSMSNIAYNLSNHQQNNFGAYKINESETGEYKTTTIDKEMEGVDGSISLIWLDVELYETKVLMGAEESIRKHRPIVIIEGPEQTDYSSTKYLKTLGYRKTARFMNDEVYEHKEKPQIFEDKTMKKILVAIPTAKYIEVETFKSLWDLDVPEGYELDFRYSFGYSISQIRNLISEWAKSYDYLLSLDSDIVLPKDALTKMIAADKDVISGLYIQRIPNTHTLEVYMDTRGGGCTNIPYHLIQNRGISEIAACGMGAALIKSEVFRRMQYPHFFYQESLTIEGTVSEDVYFCKKARDAGFTIWADPSIKCDHKGSDFFTVDSRPTPLQVNASQDLLPEKHAKYLRMMNLEPKVIYDIGACVQHWTRKAKEVWPNSKYYLVDATNSVQPFLASDEYAIAVLSDQDGRLVDFYDDTNNPAGNSYYQETTGAYTDEHRTRRITSTLDTIVKQNKWDKPDLIKIDVQGAELDVLLGAKETLSECSDIIVECQNVNYNDGAPHFDDVKAYLESIGYKFVSTIHKTNVDGDYHFSRNE